MGVVLLVVKPDPKRGLFNCWFLKTAKMNSAELKEFLEETILRRNNEAV